ncbi:MAG TPA: hypothetical protein VGQ81_02485 [Acidobacteriota bacterium]|nr:hypothetical protein [Acidobacteriota bacterium]
METTGDTGNTVRPGRTQIKADYEHVHVNDHVHADDLTTRPIAVVGVDVIPDREIWFF